MRQGRLGGRANLQRAGRRKARKKERKIEIQKAGKSSS